MSRGKKNTTVGRRNKAGFSMAEVLIVVAIITILSGIVGVSAVSMYRNMKQTQLDKTAETIFHAAQDRLSEIYAYGREETIEDGNLVDSVADAATKKVMYISSSEADKSKSAYTAIMGNNTVSADILNNYWIIEYQASSCRVLNVVYADKSGEGLGSFGGGINEAPSFDAILADLKLHSFTDRKNRYGWFGDATLTDLQDQEKQVGNTSVDVEVINEENLYAHVRVSVGWEDNLSQSDVSKFLEHQKLIITIRDADDASLSAASKDFEIPGKDLLGKGTIESDSDGFYNAKSDGDDGTGYVTDRYLTASFDMLLDSLSAGAFTGSNSKKTFEGYSTGIPSGNNFYFIARLESDDGSTPVVQDYDIDNSKFASYSPSAGKAYIEYGRHLQNAAVAQLSNLNAVQIADIDFNSEATVTRDGNFDEFNKYWLSVYPDVSGYTDYQPSDSAFLDSYDGQNHVIKNLDISKASEGSGNAGIFGNLSSCVSVKNVIITDSSVNAPEASAAGMFAAKISGTSALTVEKCYIGNVNVDASSAASAGGFAGEIATVATVTDFAALKVNAGNTVEATDAGAFAGKITGKFTGNRLFVLGGNISGSSNAGGLVGYSDAAFADMTLSGCKVSGAKVTSHAGNAGAIAGNVNNQNGTFTINSDTVVAGSIVRSETGSAGGFVGSSDSNLIVIDSIYYMPGSGEAAQTAGKVSGVFAGAVGLTASSEEVALTYGDLVSIAGFKYLNELKTSSISGMQWISGASNAGGLVGVSTKNVTITNTSASGVLAASNGNAGGFIGSTSGRLFVTGSYSDFYISGKRVGGFAAGCGSNSTFSSCYSAGFLVGTADIAAGFAPVDVGTITNSYTVFNFDDVTDTALFTGTAEEDIDHKINENGTVVNYPTVQTHSYYPVAKSSSGKAYYVYSETDFEANDNVICVRASELADNKNEDGETLLSGSFVKSQGKNNTVPYTLSPFFGSILKDYPFPTLKVSKTVEGVASETILRHYNDWLIIDQDSIYDIEVWYMLYDENLKTLKTNVAGVGNTGIRLHTKARALPVKYGTDTEYQINVGSREVFSGYKFVGYFDPVSATKPLAETSASFDRGSKCDYLSSEDENLLPAIKRSLKNGDIVVQTSIAKNNDYGYKCPDNSSIFEEVPTNVYRKTKRIYAVYRYNKPYTVSLSYVEYELPDIGATTEQKKLDAIYNGSKVASADIFEVTYKEPDRPASLASDEELTADYLAERILYEQYLSDHDETKYKNALSALDAKRASANQIITRNIPDYSKAGFDLFDIDALKNKGLITSAYATYIKNMPVYTLVRIDPDTRDYGGNEIEYKDRCKKVEKSTDNKISIQTNKAYHYVIMYNSNKPRKILNLVFNNTVAEGDDNIPVVNSYDSLSETLEKKAYAAEQDVTYEVRVGSNGFQDQYKSLDELMKPSGYPVFNGFTLKNAKHETSALADTLTLTYDRATYSLAFRLNDPVDLNPVEKYYDSKSRNEVTGIPYGRSYHEYLWELSESEATADIQCSSATALQRLKNTNEINIYSDGRWYSLTDSYEKLLEMIVALPESSGYSGGFYLQYRVGNGKKSYTEYNYFTWTKTPGSKSYAFNRSGYFLSGFKYYYQDDEGEISYNGRNYTRIGEVTSFTDVLTMPYTDVLVEAEWRVDPKRLRVEIYYQDPYDAISATDSEKKYEFFAETTCNVANGVATTQYNHKIQITELVASVNTSEGLVGFLEPYFKNGDFTKKEEHWLNNSFNPYIGNEENSLRYGYPHDAGNDTMVVALYYDRKPVEYRFHFTTTEHNGRYYINQYQYYPFTIRDQWDDFEANSSLYNYSGSASDHLALKNELVNATGQYVNVGKHARVKVVDESQSAVVNTQVTYGGLASWNNYYTSTYTSGTVTYGRAIYYQALYGAPAVFSSDGESMIPYWYCYKTNSNPIGLQRYIIGGSGNPPTLFNDYSLRYFGDVTSNTASLEKDLYPTYPSSNSGFYYFYTEVAPSEKPSDWDDSRVRTSASQAVNINMFGNDPTISTPGKDRNVSTYFITNGSTRIFIDGYTTYAYALDNRAIQIWTPAKVYVDDETTNMYIYLKRNTYNLRLVGATLKPGSGYNTEFLYKQVISRLPSEDELVSPGSDYVFDGWYTSSAYTTRIADENGVIDEDYKALPTTLVSGNDLLMNYEDLQAFPKWAPRDCQVTYNPFYPDAMSYGIDDRLGTITVQHGNTIAELPEVLAPLGTTYANREITKEDGELYYSVLNEAGDPVLKYKFLGWFKYSGLDTPKDMSDLTVQVVENVTPITDHTVLYAKWEQVLGEALYTVYCLDYSNDSEEILIVRRSGVAGEELTVAPPAFNDEHPTDVGAPIKGSYDDLKNYEALTSAITKILTNGMIFKFRYKEASDWKYVVKNCIHVDDGTEDGKDIVISQDLHVTSFSQIQLAAKDIKGYSISAYKIGDGEWVPKTSTSDYIPIEKPEDVSVPLEVQIRYTLDDVLAAKASEVDYFKYDALDLVKCNVEIKEGESWKDILFDWQDADYAPAILYTSGTEWSAIGIIGDATSEASVIEDISDLTPETTYNVQMKLVAVSKADSSYLEIKNIGETAVTVKESANYLQFGSGSGIGKIYYAFAGNNKDYWYWDKQLTSRIGPDGTSITTADISGLSGEVKTNAEAVQSFIIAAFAQDVERFVIIKDTTPYIMVNDEGNLTNGPELTSNLTAYALSTVGQGTSVGIDLYDAEDNYIGTITVDIPTGP